MDKNKHILVADDDRSSRLLMRRAMEQSGFRVSEAENGFEALAAFGSLRPDLVLLDISMPEMDGLDTCRLIRARSDGSAVPIVIITATNEIEDIRAAYEAGATDFMSKPVNPVILGERVRYMLRAVATAQQLHQNQELLASAQAVAHLGSFYHELNAADLRITEECRKILNLPVPSETITWDTLWENIYPDDRIALEPVLQEALEREGHFRKDIRIWGAGQETRYAMLQVDSETDALGKVVGYVGIIQDITERKLLELLKEDQNKILQLIVRKGSLEEIYFESARLLERQRPDSRFAICRVESGWIQKMISPDLPAPFLQSIINRALGLDNGTCAAAAYLGRPVVAWDIATSPFWKSCRSAALVHGLHSSASVPIFSGSGQLLGTVAMMRRDNYRASDRDLRLMEQVANLIALAVEQDHLSQLLKHQARNDPLTGLFNRGAFDSRLSRILKDFDRTRSSGAYLLVDLDRFKHINDSFGHQAGDLLLKVVSARLRQCVREDDLLGRIGGDEFVLVLTEVKDEKEILLAATRILKSFNSPFSIEGRSLHIEASIGITLFPQDGLEPAVLHKNADIAMYVAKNQGGNQFQFYENEMQKAVIHRLQIENDLRKALERREFELYYQPQFSLDSSRLTAMEALIRWNHPERGIISADLFIRVAEETRLIIPIGQWVLQEACRQCMEWRQQGLPPVRVSVNVSAVQFTLPSFIGSVRQILEETGLDPCSLEIEITETVVLNDFEKTVHNLQKLKALGVTTTLDDFGTGYSSISYLRNMPLDAIKIDQAFLRDMKKQPVSEDKNMDFVKAFAGLAQNLHLQLVAEGVESEEQCNLLKSLGYGTGQGYYFSKPLPAVEAAGFLAGQYAKAAEEHAKI